MFIECARGFALRQERDVSPSDMSLLGAKNLKRGIFISILILPDAIARSVKYVITLIFSNSRHPIPLNVSLTQV